jgi:ATP-dependent Clp protease ATP-binding subunit ClpX
MPLTVDAMVNILTEPKNALVRQYQHLFSIEGCKLSFTNGALRVIAERAAARETGARALRAVMEEIMMNLMYDLPEQARSGDEYVIDERAVQRNVRVLADLRTKRKETA